MRMRRKYLFRMNFVAVCYAVALSLPVAAAELVGSQSASEGALPVALCVVSVSMPTRLLEFFLCERSRDVQRIL
jgi:hypothetical protein